MVLSSSCSESVVLPESATPADAPDPAPPSRKWPQSTPTTSTTTQMATHAGVPSPRPFPSAVESGEFFSPAVLFLSAMGLPSPRPRPPGRGHHNQFV